MPSEHTHFATIGQLRIIIEIVFKGDIVEKSFKIIGLPCTNNIVIIGVFGKGEELASNCGCKHSHSISSFTI